jgi:hypothetical protein
MTVVSSFCIDKLIQKSGYCLPFSLLTDRNWNQEFASGSANRIADTEIRNCLPFGRRTDRYWHQEIACRSSDCPLIMKSDCYYIRHVPSFVSIYVTSHPLWVYTSRPVLCEYIRPYRIDVFCILQSENATKWKNENTKTRKSGNAKAQIPHSAFIQWYVTKKPFRNSLIFICFCT